MTSIMAPQTLRRTRSPHVSPVGPLVISEAGVLNHGEGSKELLKAQYHLSLCHVLA
jgi:hypothetical protein